MRLSAATAALLLLAGCGDTASTAESTGPGGGGDASDGQRWVGMNDVVVAVPEWWTTGETQCLAPVEDTVYFDSTAMTDCAAQGDTDQAVREVSALAVLDATSGYGELMTRDMVPVFEVDGHQVIERAECEEWFPDVCRQMFAVPDLGVLFAVTIDEAGDGSYEEIRDSLRVLPDDLTTVPLRVGDHTPSYGAEPVFVRRLVSTLEDAGLVVEQVTPPKPEPGDQGMVADLPPGSLLDVSPPLGSAVEQGATVTITVMGERP